MAIKLISTPNPNKLDSRDPPHEETLQLLQSGVMNGGLVTQYEPKNIEPNQLTEATNCDIRDDKTQRSSGYTIFTPTKPDNNSVIKLVSYKQFDETVQLVRFTPTGDPYVWSSGAWTQITGAGLNGLITSLISGLSFNDSFYFGNQIDPLQIIDFAASTYANAGNAPSYKYWCVFNDRIVGFNRYDPATPNPIELGWSGDFNPTEWNPLVDISAGSKPLIDTPKDFSDEGTGLFSFTDVMVLTRMNTIWVAAKQAIATDPFYCYTEVKSMGCDAPRSIQPIPNGLCFYSRKFNNIFVYSIGNPTPQPIGDKVRSDIVSAINNNANGADSLFSTYDADKYEYIICVPSDSSPTALQWKFNFINQAWSANTIDNVSYVESIDFAAEQATINDLIGTIDSLTGTIDELSPETTSTFLFYGKTDGNILIEANTIDTVGSDVRSTIITSKLMQVPLNVTFITQLHLEIKAKINSTLLVYYSKDGGNKFILYKTVSITGTDVNKNKRYTFMKNIRATSYQWKIVCSSGLFDLYKYYIYHYPYGGYQRSGSA